MQRKDFPYFYPLRVRYAEVDAQNIVFNAHYYTWFDCALTEFMRDCGYDYKTMIEQDGLDFHLVKSSAEYLAPVHFDDELEIGVKATRIGSSSLTWSLGVFRKGEEDLLTLGEIIWVCARPGTHKSHPLPEGLKEAINGFAG